LRKVASPACRGVDSADGARAGDDSGFTLVELLLVIVVIGILAATVIFALGSVTGQSAEAACNSDAKTAEVAVQAYVASPDNSSHSHPNKMAELYAAPFGDTFMTNQSNTAYTVFLGGDTLPVNTDVFSSGGTTSATGNPTDGVYVMKTGETTAYLFDDPGTGGTNECANVT
jgi:prepilin-type N-terminal cleavage/methylation domain-containing protein